MSGSFGMISGIGGALTRPVEGGALRGLEDPIDRGMSPMVAESILGLSYGGDLAQWYGLVNDMVDMWDRLSTNVRTLEDALAGAPWEVVASVRPGEDEAGDEAQRRADVVRSALWGMRPEVTDGELDGWGLIRGLALGVLRGHGVWEVLWERRAGLLAPRAVTRVGPRWFGYPRGDGRLRFRGAEGWGAFPADKFLTLISRAHDGPSAQSGRLRVLVKYWGGAVYGWGWLVQHVQRFGQPFRWATYRDQNVRDQVLAMLGSLGAAGYGAFPEGTQLQLLDAKSSGGELPQEVLVRLADQACDLVTLGETASKGTEGTGGLGNTGEVFAGVRRQALQGVINEGVGAVQQLARMICRLNFGDEELCPVVRCEIPEPKDARLMAERDEVLVRMGMRLPEVWLHERHDVPVPSEGERVIVKGAEVPAPGAVPLAAGKVRVLEAAKGEDDGLVRAMEELVRAGIAAGLDEWEEETKGKEQEGTEGTEAGVKETKGEPDKKEEA